MALPFKIPLFMVGAFSLGCVAYILTIPMVGLIAAAVIFDPRQYRANYRAAAIVLSLAFVALLAAVLGTDFPPHGFWQKGLWSLAWGLVTLSGTVLSLSIRP